jgi:membrane protease YdiL (CAAX protease family)
VPFLPLLAADGPDSLQDGSLHSLVLIVAASSLAMMAFALGFAGLAKAPFRTALGWVPTAPGIPLRSGALLVAGAVAFSHCLDLAIEHSGLRDASTLEFIDRAVAGAAGADLALAVVALAIGPAVAEETLFRGVLFGRLRPRMGLVGAAIVSSLAFGLLHGELAQGGGAALLGLYLAAVTSRSGGLALPMACHLANNTAAVLAAAWDVSGRLGTAGWLGLGVVAAVVFLAAIRCLRQLEVPTG